MSLQTQSILLNGLNFKIYTWGDSKLPPLFFVHGWMDTGASFHFVCEQLKKHFYCIAPDLRGFGGSDHTPSALGYFFVEYVADAHALFQHFSPLEKLRIVGHSMGGNLASLYAGTFPERVSHFINIEGFGLRDSLPEEGPARLRKWIESSPRESTKFYQSLEPLLEKLVKKHPTIRREHLQVALSGMVRKERAGYRIAADLKHQWPNPYLYQLRNIQPFLKQIQAQCLIVLGEKSSPEPWSLTQEDIQERLQEYPITTQNKIILNAGHMIHWEQPDLLAEAIEQFIGVTN